MRVSPLPLFLVATLALAPACSSDSDSADPSGDGGMSADGGGEVVCESGVDTVELELEWVETGPGSKSLDHYTIRQPTVRGGEAILPASFERRDGDDTEVEVYLLKADGSSSLLTSTEGYASSMAAVSLDDGRDCVLFEDDTIKMACSDGTVEDSGLDADKDTMLPMLLDDGTLSVYTQNYAAYAEFRRTPAGSWSEIEKYESSISWPTDVLLHQGEPAVCFISTGDRAVIEYGGSDFSIARQVSTESAKWCRLVADSEVLHVLTDQGYATIAWQDLSPSSEGTFVEDTSILIEDWVLDLARVEGHNYAIVRNSETQAIELVSLVDGSRQPVADEARHATYDPDLEAVLTVQSSADSSAEPPMQTVEIRTLCDSDWN